MSHKIKISRSQLNPTQLLINTNELSKKINGLLEEINYDVDDEAYKFKGDPKKIDEVQFLIVGIKNIDNYTQFEMKVDVYISNAKMVKVEKGRKTKNMIQGKGKITILSTLIFDYDDKWSKDPILHFLQKIYERYLYVGTKKALVAKIAKEMYSIEGEMRNYLGME